MADITSTKRFLINKANTTVVVLVSVAAFLAVFSLVAAKTLFNQYTYQNKIISGKRDALDQIKADITAATELKSSYNAFVGTSQNVIGGNSVGVGAQDGNNAKIILDALPSTYDFPALTTSLEKLLSSQKVKIDIITGTDDQVAQASNTSAASPQAVAIPFQVGVTGNYDQVKAVLNAFEHSIRPMQITKLDLSGNQSSLTLSIDAQTYYQPAKSLNIGTKVVK